MNWSLEIGKPAGIAVRVHATFALLLAWAGVSAWREEHTIIAALGAMAWVLAVFTLVILHELGHALAARRFGCKTRDILLLPIGGVARLERMPSKPGQELVVAIAGPAVNVLIAASLGLLAYGSQVPLTGNPDELPALAQLFWVNVALAIFNLIPAFPMDGGRALRALLALRFERVKATRIAAGLGQAVAVLLGLVGLTANPMLALVAIFVWMGAAAERGHTELEVKLQGVTTAQAMMTEFDALSPESHIGEAVDRILAGFQADFPVVRNDAVVGLLERDAIVKALAEGGSDAPIAGYLRKEWVSIEAGTQLVEAMERLSESEQNTLPVVHRGKLVGLLSAAQLAEFVMLGDAVAAFVKQRQAASASASGLRPRAV